MIGILIFLLVALSNALVPQPEHTEEELKNILIANYFNKIPDMEPKYVINDALSRMIGTYFRGKLKTFPLFKMSIKLDRKPVKIPWVLGDPIVVNSTSKKEKYKYVKVEKGEE